MKHRNGFVTNSSSSSFILTNHTSDIVGNEDWIPLWENDIREYCDDYGIPFNLDEWLDYSHNIGDFLLGPNESYQFSASNEDGDRFELFICYLYDKYEAGLELSCRGRE